MSDQSDVIESYTEPAVEIKTEPLKKAPEEMGDVRLADDIKEPEEEEHQAECHLLNGSGRSDGERMESTEGEKEKGELDSCAESEKKDEQAGWLYILGHNLLKKRVLQKGGDTMSRPTNGQLVSIRYSATLYVGDEETEQWEDKVVVDSSDKLTFILGDGDVIMAFDLCVALMGLEEVCEVVADAKYAHGAQGKKPSIPANASMHYHVELLSVQDAPKMSELPAVDRARMANEKRERGNMLYSHGEYGHAISAYTKALQYVDSQYDVGVTEENELQLLLDTRLKCYNNLAAAQLKLEAWDAAIKSTNQVLRVQPKNVKALFRKGKCLAGKAEITDAIAVLREALQLEPETKIIHQELSRLMAKQKKQEESQRQMYQRMIGADKQEEPSTSPKKSKVSQTSILTMGALVTGVVAVGLGVYKYVQHL